MLVLLALARAGRPVRIRRVPATNGGLDLTERRPDSGQCFDRAGGRNGALTVVNFFDVDGLEAARRAVVRLCAVEPAHGAKQRSVNRTEN